MNSKKIACPKCGYVGKSKTLRKGSFFVELILWLCFFIPGLIYSIWRLSNKYDICPCCGNEEWIPADSPKGEKITDKSHIEECKAPKTQSIHETKPTDWEKVVKVGSKIFAVIFLLIGIGLFSSYKFPYNLTQVFVAISAIFVLVPSWIGKLLKDSYKWKFIKLNRKTALILIGVFSFIFWVVLMPSSVSIQIENPKTKSVRVEQETFDLQFQTTNTDEVFLNGEKIDAQKGFNQRELNLQDGENEIELSVIDHYTGEKKSITTNIIYISPKMKEQEEFIKNYPLPKIEVISSLTPETTEKEYILQVRAENTTKLKLNGKIMEESEGVFEKRILLEHKSTKIILEAENLHKEIVENFIVSREETQEEKSLREEKRLNSISNELKELEMILKEIPERDFSIYYDSISKIDLALNLFHTWAEEIKKAEESPHLEIQALGEKIRSAVVKKQVIEFPRLRKAYGKISANKLWVNDIEVSVYGSSNSVIEYTGGVFAANRNIREAYTIVKTQLRDLRFDQANYKWYSGDDEYTYYTIGSRLDTEIVY